MQLTLSPFIFAQDGNKNLIIQTKSSLCYAQIITGANKNFGNIYELVPGYDIAIVYMGSLFGAPISPYEISKSLKEMILFFIEEKLNKNLKYYHRYKDTSSDLKDLTPNQLIDLNKRISDIGKKAQEAGNKYRKFIDKFIDNGIEIDYMIVDEAKRLLK